MGRSDGHGDTGPAADHSGEPGGLDQARPHTGEDGSPVVAVESVNGRTGLVLRRDGRAVGAVSVSVAGAEVVAVWIVLNPDKLHGWHHP
ncbi:MULTISPECIES: hypothetical protein [unclassified Nonomuraea]|uniref:hypothetical protein n=1 Tax=unclassified Nonomuraea TaxID=2593643 RepID=UPI0033EAFB91